MQATSGFLIAVALVAVGGNVNAALVQFDFSGSATSVPDPFNDFAGSVNVGDSFVGSFAYDLGTPDIQPLAELGYYLQSPVTTGVFSASVGLLTFQLKPGTDFGVTVLNGSTDELFISGTLLDSTGHQWHTELKLEHSPGATGPFSDDSLPASLDLANFNVAVSFRLLSESPSQAGLYPDSFWGGLETLTAVPEPSSAFLTIAGLVGLVAVVRRQRHKKHSLTCTPAFARVRSPATNTPEN